MDAKPFLVTIAEALDAVGLEAILVGNAAAALHGAPVSTLDFDFMFRKTPANLGKLKKLAERLDAVIFRPYYPASGGYSSTSCRCSTGFAPSPHCVPVRSRSPSAAPSSGSPASTT